MQLNEKFINTNAKHKPTFYQKGQSLAEAVVWGGLFLTLIATIPMIIKVADVKNKHLEASRYAVWERTVWNEEGKPNAKIDDEIESRIMRHPSAALTGDSEAEYPFWTHKGQNILQGKEQGTNSIETGFTYRAPAGQFEPELDFGLNLAGNAVLTVKTNFIDRFVEDGNYDHNKYIGAGSGIFTLETQAALLTDEWTLSPDVPPESLAAERALTDEMAELYAARIEEEIEPTILAIETITLPGVDVANTYGALPDPFDWFYSEGKYANEFITPVYSDVIEEKYVKPAKE